jgi:hypothetical protein
VSVTTTRANARDLPHPDSDRYKWLVLTNTTLRTSPPERLLGAHVISTLSPAARTTIVGRKFFPMMIQKAFVSGLHPALDFATIICALAAVTSWMRGAPTGPLKVNQSVSVEAPTNAN